MNPDIPVNALPTACKLTARSALIHIAVICLLTLPTGALAHSTSIGPLALMLAQHQKHAPTVNTLQGLGLIHYRKGTQLLIASMLVRFQRDLTDITGLDARVNKVIGDVASIDIPVSKLNSLSLQPYITYAELARPLHPDLDIAVPETGAAALRSGTPPEWIGATGRNVIVGIVDSGIDLKHADFRDTSGKTRILYVFDDTADVECTRAQIDAGSCNEVDSNGHGTHVAGIAAGNGSATGNGQPPYRYVGMAPEANLIVAKTNWTTASVIDGIEDIEETAKTLGMPVVINLSMATEIGPHDGTDNTSRALNYASGPGRIVVVSAGNYAVDDNHASAAVAAGKTTVTDLTVPVDTTFTLVDVWYAGADQFAVNVYNGADCDTGVVQAPVSIPYTQGGFCGNRVFIESENINPLNGDREILVEMNTSDSSPFASPTWHIALQGTVVTQGKFNAWVNTYTSGSKFLTNIDTSDTLGSFAAATAPITVTAYNTKNTWNSMAGPISKAISNPLGEIAYFSSRGPRRLCSDLEDCPVVQKPEITAPGAWIASSYSAQTQWPAGSCAACYIDPDGVHRLMQGTSMSAPMVTGAVALLLQANPSAIPDDIKALLEGNATTDDFTGSTPNDTWGYGKLNVKAAFDALQAPSLPAPQGVTVTADTTSATLTWSPVTALDLAGYSIYRSTVSGGSYTKVAAVSAADNQYTDSGLAVGTYYYVLRSVDTNGLESLASTEISTTIVSGGGGGACGLLTLSFLTLMVAIRLDQICNGRPVTSPI